MKSDRPLFVCGGCVWDLICFEEVGYGTMKGGFVSLPLFTYDINSYVVILIMMFDCFDIYLDYDSKNNDVHGYIESDARKAYGCCPFSVHVPMSPRVDIDLGFIPGYVRGVCFR